MAKIIGDTTVTPMPVPDLAQTDERKADYIKNKKISFLENDIGYAEKAYVDGKVCEIDEALNEIIASGIADIYSTADDTGRQMVVIITLTDGRQLSFGVPYGEKGEDGVGIDNVYTLPYEGGRGVVLQLSNGLVYSFDVNDGHTPVKGVDYWTEEDKAEILSEIPKSGTWKTLIDTTLTEEQANVSIVKIEIPDVEALKNATRIRTYVDIHSGENEIAQQGVHIKIGDYSNSAYGFFLCYSQAANKCGVGQKWMYRGTTEIIPTASHNNSKTVLTFYSIPNVNTGANAVTNATKITEGFPMKNINSHPPYLRIELGSGGLMAAGTKIFMEVCE